MTAPEAARLASTLRAARKHQGLSGSDLADRIERLTGLRPGPLQITRWFNGDRALLRISPDLPAIAAALGLDPIKLVTDAAVDAITADTVRPDDAGPSPLTARERQVADLIAAGWPQSAIAIELELKLHTVRNHITRAMQKLGVQGRRDRAARMTAALARYDAALPARTCPHPTSTEPDVPGQGCSRCCDTCNNDGHRCEECGQPIGHLKRRCPDCPDPDEMDAAPNSPAVPDA